MITGYILCTGLRQKIKFMTFYLKKRKLFPRLCNSNKNVNRTNESRRYFLVPKSVYYCLYYYCCYIEESSKNRAVHCQLFIVVMDLKGNRGGGEMGCIGDINWKSLILHGNERIGIGIGILLIQGVTTEICFAHVQ